MKTLVIIIIIIYYYYYFFFLTLGRYIIIIIIIIIKNECHSNIIVDRFQGWWASLGLNLYTVIVLEMCLLCKKKYGLHE